MEKNITIYGMGFWVLGVCYHAFPLPKEDEQC
jgi:hypothetical protein